MPSSVPRAASPPPGPAEFAIHLQEFVEGDRGIGYRTDGLSLPDYLRKSLSAIPAPFPMDLLVRTPKNLEWRLEEGDWFLREVVSQGKVLYEKNDR